MSNLTVAVDDEVIKRARIRAIEEGTSVSARVREFLGAYAAGRLSAAVGAAAPVVPYRAAPASQTAGSEQDPGAAHWVAKLRAEVAAFGGIEPEEWLAPRDAGVNRPLPDFGA